MAAKIEKSSTALRIPEGALVVPRVTISDKSLEQLAAIRASGRIIVTDRGKYLFKYVVLPSELQTVEFIITTPSKMGLTEDLTTTRVLTCGMDKWDLDKSSFAEAVGLRMAMKQPLDEEVYVAVDPMPGSDGLPTIPRFARNSNGEFFDANWADDNYLWGKDTKIAFVVKSSRTQNKI